jgi:hypothetical protein
MQTVWEDVNFRVVEITLVSSIIASVLIIIYSIITGEIFEWNNEIIKSTRAPEGLILIICISIALPILKLLVRNSKYSIIQVSNAFFFEFVQASSALLGSLMNIIIFQEPWGNGYIVALLLLGFSFIIYSYAKKVGKKVGIAEPQIIIYNNIEIKNPINNEDPKPITIVESWK